MENGQEQDTGHQASSPLENAAQSALSGQGGLTPQQEAFLELQDEKGEKKVFKTKDEFLKEFPKMASMRSDYLRKTNSFAEEQRKFKAEYERQKQEVETQRKEIERYNSFLRDNPHVFQQLKNSLQGGTTPEIAQMRAKGYVDEKYSQLEKQLQELSEWKQQRELSEKKAGLYSHFKQKYPDFDEETIELQLNQIAEGDHEALLDMLYHANKGRLTPAQIERRLVEKTVEKQKGALLPSGNSPASSKKYKSLEDAEKAVLEDLK